MIADGMDATNILRKLWQGIPKPSEAVDTAWNLIWTQMVWNRDQPRLLNAIQRKLKRTNQTIHIGRLKVRMLFVVNNVRNDVGLATMLQVAERCFIVAELSTWQSAPQSAYTQAVVFESMYIHLQAPSPTFNFRLINTRLPAINYIIKQDNNLSANYSKFFITSQRYCSIGNSIIQNPCWIWFPTNPQMEMSIFVS